VIWHAVLELNNPQDWWVMVVGVGDIGRKNTKYDYRIHTDHYNKLAREHVFFFIKKFNSYLTVQLKLF
jgi:NADH/NAD ratio-sensing transcriptional regulator Rex